MALANEFSGAITLSAGWTNLGAALKAAGYEGYTNLKFLQITPADDAPNPVYIYHSDTANTEPAAPALGQPYDGASMVYTLGVSAMLLWLYVAAETDIYVTAQGN